MNINAVSIDDLDALQRIMANTEVLLLDFDGPVCSIFTGIKADYIARQLRALLMNEGHTDLPSEIADVKDPFAVFDYSAMVGKRQARSIEAALRTYEVDATVTAEPTSGSHELIKRWLATGRKIAIVSNNSEAAVNAYLLRHKLTYSPVPVFARTAPDPGLLKPSPHLINQAVHALDARRGNTVLIGDSLTDLRAAHAANIRFVAYANKLYKVAQFKNAAAQTILTDLRPIVEAI